MLPAFFRSGLTLPNGRPRVGELFASRRSRWLARAVVGVIFLTVFFASSNRMPAIRTSSSWSYQQQTEDNVDWSRFAYVQYATDAPYLCNSVMFFERLEHLQSKPDRVLLYPSYMLDPDAATEDNSEEDNSEEDNSEEAKLLVRARDNYRVKLVPITIQHIEGEDSTWADSFTKLLSFNQTQYKRTISIDSDSTLHQHVDELFLLPSTPLAATRAYWLSHEDESKLNSQLLIIEPSKAEFARIAAKIENAGPNEYDMEIINDLYKKSAMVLPHRPYVLLTGTIRAGPTDSWLGNNETWDPVAAYNEARIIHFSDWPRPKPWLPAPAATIEEMRPKCVMKGDVEDCSAAALWEGIYADFAARRKRVCDVSLEDEPEGFRRRWSGSIKKTMN